MSARVKYLIFLESFTKKKTIESFLQGDKEKSYQIFATGGHLTELAKVGYNNLGLGISEKDLDFIPRQTLLPEKKKVLLAWKNYLKNNQQDLILLATDPDREGEAISQAIVNLLELKPQQYKRLLFYEITETSLRQALTNLTELNQQLVDSQKARQVTDRIIGFCLSPLLQRALKALSAGRVQSVVLKLIVEREEAWREFEKNKQYILQIVCWIGSEKHLLRQKDQQGKLVVYSQPELAEKTLEKLGTTFFLEKKIKEKRYIFPKPPLITSLLLSEAKFQLGFDIATTTRLAQQLYEGVYLKNLNKRVGLITYPRTDSSRLNKQFIQQVYRYVEKNWGSEYCQFSLSHQEEKKILTVQGAHEAIRPTYLAYSPSEIGESLTKEQLALYQLIYQHTLASLMNKAEVEKITYTFLNNQQSFTLSENLLIFPGFFLLTDYYLSAYRVRKTSLSTLVDLNSLEASKIEIKEHLENRPHRYNEGSLVQQLEKLGIGRPSTYNTFSKILLKRNYVEYNPQKNFIPTLLGEKVNAWLQANFASLINEKYTASLESDLDKISQGENTYLEFIRLFWKSFFPHWQEVSNHLSNQGQLKE